MSPPTFRRIFIWLPLTIVGAITFTATLTSATWLAAAGMVLFTGALAALVLDSGREIKACSVWEEET